MGDSFACCPSMPQSSKLGKAKPMQKAKRGMITKEIKKSKHKPKAPKRTAAVKTKKKLLGNHISQMEALMADKVTSQNQKLHVVKTNSNLIKDLKQKEAKKKQKYG